MYDAEVIVDPFARFGGAVGVAQAPRIVSLAQARRGDRGVVVGVGVGVHAPHLHGLLDGHGVHNDELERRLLEIGFVEGAQVSVLHEGLFGRDPLAVRVDDTRVALRRREAADILIQLHG